MKTFKWLAVVILFLGLAISLDIRLANDANEEILESSADFQRRLSDADLDFTGERIQSCEIHRVYIVNAYQTCFVAWYGEPGDGIQGFTYVYHRPHPISLFYGQTSDSRYFSFMEYGIRLKQVRQDGFVNHLYLDGSE